MTHTRSLSWTPVALSTDVPSGTVIPVSLNSVPVAVWRTQSGHLSANGDRCPHRGMRLSHGFVRGETLSCIYHGWRYADDGSCTHIPAHPDLDPPKSIKCAPRAVTESGGIIWIADTKPETRPKSFEGFKPLRALVIDANQEALQEVTQTSIADSSLVLSIAGADTRLLLTNLGEKGVFVIVLLSADASPETGISVSRRIEVIRQKAELAYKSGEKT